MPLLCPYCNRFEYEEGIGCATCTACTLLIHRVGEEGFTTTDHRWLGGELNRLLGDFSYGKPPPRDHGRGQGGLLDAGVLLRRASAFRKGQAD